MAIQPDYPEVQLQTAEIYHHENRYGRLLATLDRLQDSVGPEATPVRADVLQGIAMRHAGRFAEAQKNFVRAIGKDPADASLHLEMASLMLESGNLDEAKLALATALSIDPNSLQRDNWAERFHEQQERLALQQQAIEAATDLR